MVNKKSAIVTCTMSAYGYAKVDNICGLTTRDTYGVRAYRARMRSRERNSQIISGIPPGLRYVREVSMSECSEYTLQPDVPPTSCAKIHR